MLVTGSNCRYHGHHGHAKGVVRGGALLDWTSTPQQCRQASLKLDVQTIHFNLTLVFGI